MDIIDLSSMTKRITKSYLPPISWDAEKCSQGGYYNIYPAYEVEGEICEGLEHLVERLCNEKTLVIDGFEGVFWGRLISQVERALTERGKRVCLIDIADCLKSESEIEDMIAPFMGGEESIFGRMTTLRLIDLFERSKLNTVERSSSHDITIVYGCGASLVDLEGAKLVYVDLPKNELQFRMKAGVAFNLGSQEVFDERKYYKRCYFIDWPILDAYRGALIDRIDWVVDEQRIDNYTFMDGDTLREGLDAMSRNSFRVRPWFAPGVWGGNYMRDNIEGLNRDVDNLAWSFELMALENGVMFSHAGVLLEVSFSLLMSYRYRAVLGHCADDFKTDFPIRFDFLDTINGGNLSIQCHPRPEYIRSQFGKEYTQDETYYILRATDDAKVYLGFQEGVELEPLHNALMASQSSGEALDIEEYVQCFAAKQHDLFLIPNGTIHASGSGNMVLEISSAPYIFTFKMYDWVRLDIDGRPRPINVDHGIKNVRIERSGDVVADTLICKPYIMSQSDGCVQEHLPTHPDHFYDVHRYRLASGAQLNIDNNDRCHVWMIVEGRSIELSTKFGQTTKYSYIETFIVPAATESYTISNCSDADVMMVKAFVKDSYIL